MSDEAGATAVETKEQPGVASFTTKADKTEGAREITIEWNIGKDLSESAEIFGETVVHGMFEKAIIVAAQANIRRMLSAQNEDGSQKYSDEAIVNYVHTEYKPGVRAAREGGSAAMEKLIAKLMKMTPEQRKALIGV